MMMSAITANEIAYTQNDNTIDEMNNTTNENPTIRYMAGNPSLYITKKKEK